MYKFQKQDIYIIGLMIILSIVSFLIIKDFIVPLMFTGILVYLFYPAYKKINKYLKNHFITSMLSILLILVIIIFPIIFTIVEVSEQFSVLENEQIANSLDTLSEKINSQYNLNVTLSTEYYKLVEEANVFIVQLIYTGLPKFVFNIFIISFFFYYFLKNYENESQYLKTLVKKDVLIKWNNKIKKLLNGIIYGQILVRLIQAAIGTILFTIVGIKGAVIWGILMFFAAFIPLVGTALIWGPIGLLYLLQNEYQISIYIFIIGAIVSSVDNLLLPYFISEKTNIGPILTLISILGGLQLFGIYGLILGPFILGLFLVTIEELLMQIKRDNPGIKRHIWTKKERERFKSLKTEKAKKEFIEMMHRKYVLEEKQANVNTNLNLNFIVDTK